MGGEVRRYMAVAALVLAVTACTSNEGDAVVPVLDAEQVGGQQVAEGTQVLEPAVEGCAVDGSFLWNGADQGRVRQFERSAGGLTEGIVVAAWPMGRDAAEVALDRVGSQECSAAGTRVASVNIGVSGGSDTRTFEVAERDSGGEITSWQVRAYSYVEGHLVTIWVDHPQEQPSLDEVRELLDAQEQLIIDL